jgi:8-oxo-dGTP pyrophosphatase MutT (NUDIX family)
VSPVRPDLVECWIFRVPGSAPELAGGAQAEPEFLLIRRAEGRIFPGLWQCVTGGPEPGERIPHSALREVVEETGIGREDIEGFYDLDMVSSFYDEGPDAIVSGAVFALRVRRDVEPRLSHEHDAYRWAAVEEARSLAVWPSYAECLDRVRRCLIGPGATWFELDLDGRRLRR